MTILTKCTHYVVDVDRQSEIDLDSDKGKDRRYIVSNEVSAVFTFGGLG